MNSAKPFSLFGRMLGLVLLVAAVAGLLGAYWFAHNGVAVSATELPYDQFNAALENGEIYKDDKHPLNILIEEGSSIQTITGYYSKLIPASEHQDQLQQFHTTVSLDYDRDLKAQLKAAKLTPNEIRDKSNLVAATLFNFLPILIFLLILVAVPGLIIWLVVRLVSARRRPDPAAPR